MMGETPAAEAFAGHRELLFSIVYNMLGTVGDTEDVLQETWLAWAARDVTGIANPRAYLVRVAVNQALAHQSALRRRKETYLGPWLPEPLVTGPDAAEPAVRGESVSIALLVVVTERFVATAFGGDLPALMEMLAPDVVLWPDGGGRSAVGGPRPIRGRDKVARVVVANARGSVDVRYHQVNGDPSVVVFAEDAPLAVMVLDLEAGGEQVRDIYVVSNPDKLGSVPGHAAEGGSEPPSRRS
ncbi:RNA polymerase subunit sigma-24 [Microbispora triticiradicis]|uniref:RNA polymerase subunit sigma-24 n=1 Tax=Microbispora triticiradicis TaxID=2200763 RepID=A0ABX9LNH4_9ACTN|nr:sigma factor [Microbispora triticiradicis]RGA05512.1 RNA polymerase subunit sigma-24 [Microbispora triticiradicis]